MYNDIITLFNYHEGTDKWYPLIIEGTDLTELRASSNTAMGTDNADTMELIINCTADKVIKTKSGDRCYTAPKEYANCERPQDCFTFTADKDFIYCGAWPDSEPIDDDVDFDSGFYQSVNNNYDGVYKINSVAFYGLLPHFEIGGR
jgi:hypothetical protein